MSTGYRIIEHAELHFVTFQTVRGIAVFTGKVYRDIVIDDLRFCEQHKGLEIYAFVVMSNHIHRTNKTNEECEMKDLLFTFDSFCKAGALILTRRSEDATPSGACFSECTSQNSIFFPSQ
jgi:hypothetical protein